MLESYNLSTMGNYHTCWIILAIPYGTLQMSVNQPNIHLISVIMKYFIPPSQSRISLLTVKIVC